MQWIILLGHEVCAIGFEKNTCMSSFCQVAKYYAWASYDSQQYINASLATVDNGMFSCGQNLPFISIQQNIQSDKTDELSHPILNITSFGNAKDKILSQFSSRRLAR